MSSKPAIRVANLSKCYQIYDKPQDRLKQSLWRGRKQFFREFWALRDVSFEINWGETVGIIGRNGSGKSTLLQMIAGTLAPSDGVVEVNGRVAALLELGSGFNPEFTGRENVYMNASILGLGEEEIDRRFDEIVAFADILEFIDQPVKTYSSGMMVRLAFSVAINVEPQILIVDEALSVGDELFQRKCFARIRAIQETGATILFVSHSAHSVVELCNRAILLDQGELLLSDVPKAVVSRYHKLIYAPAEKREMLREEIRRQIVSPSGDGSEKSGSKSPPPGTPATAVEYDPHLVPQSTVCYQQQGAEILNPMIQSTDGRQVNQLVTGHEYVCAYSVLFKQDAYAVRFGMLIKTTSGFEIGGVSTTGAGDEFEYIENGSIATVKIRFRCLLNPGVYFVNVGCSGMAGGEITFLHRIVDAVVFRVQPEAGSSRTGVVDFLFQPSVDRVPPLFSEPGSETVA